METDGVPSFRISVHRAMGCYFARVQELPGCICRGESEVEAVEAARASIRAYLKVARVLEGDAGTVLLQLRV
jgi:predicted RNase H-like HicB family nuclease